MKRGFDRSRRVADLIQQALAHIMLQKMGDKRFRQVTITEVIISKDLSYAKIYVSVFEQEAEKIKQTVKALNQAARIFRYHLAQAVDLRAVPELKFFYDEAAAHGFKINSLITATSKDKEKE